MKAAELRLEAASCFYICSLYPPLCLLLCLTAELVCVVNRSVSRVVKPGLINAVLNYFTVSSPIFYNSPCHNLIHKLFIGVFMSYMKIDNIDHGVAVFKRRHFFVEKIVENLVMIYFEPVK